MKQSLNHDCARGALGLLLILALLNLSAQTDFTFHSPWPHSEKAEISTCQVFLEIKGDVVRPGLYCFSSPPSLSEALARAGAPLSSINKTTESLPKEPLASGTTITVTCPDNGPLRVNRSSMNAFWRFTLGIPICLDKESAEGLTALPGIGEKMARAIVETRERLGGFTHLSQLRLVPGIGPKLMGKIRPYLTLCADSE